MATTITEKLIAQFRVSGTLAQTAFTASGARYIVRRVSMNNNTVGTAFADIWHDDDGTTYDDTTQIYGAQRVFSGETIDVNVFWPIADGGSIGVGATSFFAINFSFFGVEIVDG